MITAITYNNQHNRKYLSKENKPERTIYGEVYTDDLQNKKLNQNNMSKFIYSYTNSPNDQKPPTLKPLYFPLILVALFLLIMLFCSCNRMPLNKSDGHKCRWAKCPYKGVKKENYRSAVIQYTDEEDTPAFSIDMLHLLYPKASYEKLEKMLNGD